MSVSFALAATALLVSADAEAQLGETVETFKKTSFIGFFNFKETATTKRLKRIKRFVTGGKFKPWVDLLLILKDGKISTITLTLDRAFVDHKLNRVFARDIAKSILAQGLPKAGAAAVKPLIAEIWGRGKRPAQPSAGYLVYQGKKTSHEEKLPGAKLLLRNVENKKTKKTSLVITLRAS